MPGLRDTGTGPALFHGLSCLLCCLMISTALPQAVSAGPVDDLAVGEALYMSGNLVEASQRLSSAAGSGKPAQVQRALYLLGRISLITGDFRQAKEYFERSADIKDAGNPGKWMALAGIGDTLYASGRFEEAIRRYRFALGETGSSREEAVIGLKTALCEYSLGRESEAKDHLRTAFRQIPVLSGWLGREEDFFHSMAMVGIEPPLETTERIYVRAGPVQGDFRVDEIVGPEVPVNETRAGSRSYLEFGPLTDTVEAMILSGKIRDRYSVPVEIIKR